MDALSAKTGTGFWCICNKILAMTTRSWSLDRSGYLAVLQWSPQRSSRFEALLPDETWPLIRLQKTCASSNMGRREGHWLPLSDKANRALVEGHRGKGKPGLDANHRSPENLTQMAQKYLPLQNTSIILEHSPGLSAKSPRAFPGALRTVSKDIEAIFGVFLLLLSMGSKCS